MTTKYVATVTCTQDPCTYCGPSDAHRPAETHVMRRDVHSPPTFFPTAEDALEHARGMSSKVYGGSTHRAAVVAVEVTCAIGDGGTEGERAAVAEMLGIPAPWEVRPLDPDDPIGLAPREVVIRFTIDDSDTTPMDELLDEVPSLVGSRFETPASWRYDTAWGWGKPYRVNDPRWDPSSGELKPNTSITLLRSSDPEPPVGARVRTSEGCVYRRSPLDDRRCWFAEGDDDDPESWTRVAGNYGPVALVREGSA